MILGTLELPTTRREFAQFVLKLIEAGCTELSRFQDTLLTMIEDTQTVIKCPEKVYLHNFIKQLVDHYHALGFTFMTFKTLPIYKVLCECFSDNKIELDTYIKSRITKLASRVDLTHFKEKLPDYLLEKCPEPFIFIRSGATDNQQHVDAAFQYGYTIIMLDQEQNLDGMIMPKAYDDKTVGHGFKLYTYIQALGLIIVYMQCRHQDLQSLARTCMQLARVLQGDISTRGRW